MNWNCTAHLPRFLISPSPEEHRLPWQAALPKAIWQKLGIELQNTLHPALQQTLTIYRADIFQRKNWHNQESKRKIFFCQAIHENWMKNRIDSISASKHMRQWKNDVTEQIGKSDRVITHPLIPPKQHQHNNHTGCMEKTCHILNFATMEVCDLDSRTQLHTLMIPKNGIHRIINLACDTAPSNSSSGKPDIRVFEITGSQYTRIKQPPCTRGPTRIANWWVNRIAPYLCWQPFPKRRWRQYSPAIQRKVKQRKGRCWIGQQEQGYGN